MVMKCARTKEALRMEVEAFTRQTMQQTPSSQKQKGINRAIFWHHVAKMY
jgi:hypothetical protein